MSSQYDLQILQEIEDPTIRPKLIMGESTTYASLDNDVIGIIEGFTQKTSIVWYLMIGATLSVLTMLGGIVAYLIATGVGIWGNQSPVFWGWPIVNFVFWVGIAHAGTLISAILFLLKQDWRTSINRFAEAMTIFAVCCAGLFPASTSVACGLSTGCSRSPTKWRCGRTFAVRFFGTCSQLERTQQFRCCSGTWA